MTVILKFSTENAGPHGSVRIDCSYKNFSRLGVRISGLMSASGQPQLFSGFYFPKHKFRNLSWDTTRVSFLPQTLERSRFIGRGKPEAHLESKPVFSQGACVIYKDEPLKEHHLPLIYVTAPVCLLWLLSFWRAASNVGEISGLAGQEKAVSYGGGWWFEGAFPGHPLCTGCGVILMLACCMSSHCFQRQRWKLCSRLWPWWLVVMCTGYRLCDLTVYCDCNLCRKNERCEL